MENLSKIKILHFTQPSGGIQTYLEHIFRYIDQTKYELILVCPSERKSLIKLAESYNIQTVILNLKWSISPLSDFINFIKFIKLIYLYKPDIIHSHSSKAGMLSRMARPFLRAKVIYTPNAYAYLGKLKFAKNLFFYLEKIAIPFTDILLASSKSEMKRSVYELKFKQSKVLLYPNSIETLEAIVPSNLLNNETKLITTVGRFVSQKNPLMFLKVCKRILESRKDVAFQIIGTGYDDQLLPEAKDFIAQNNLEPYVHILPWMNRESVLAEIARTDVFVMTSIFESFGYVAAEAQMLQIPVVATNVDGLNEIVDSGLTGFLVDVNQADEMADRIIYLLDHPDVAKNMGIKGALRMKEHFNVENNISFLEAAYQKAVTL